MNPHESAFPQDPAILACNQIGLTVRAYIAAKAMAAIISNREMIGDKSETSAKYAAHGAVLFADALIAELSKPDNSKLLSESIERNTL